MTQTSTSIVANPMIDNKSLRQQLKRSQRKQQLWAFALVAPLILFLLINFILPIGLILIRSVADHEFKQAMPNVVEALKDWNGDLPVSSKAAAALVLDLSKIRGTPEQSLVANRLNNDVSGYRSLIMTTARRLSGSSNENPLETLKTISSEWGKVEPWLAIKAASGPYTPMYLLSALDLKQDGAGAVQWVADNDALFLRVFGRTFWISLVVTLFCVLLGYPVAYLLATVTSVWSGVLMMMVLIPFWTALLVRTSAWVVLLQTNGVVNNFLQWAGLVPAPLPLVFNRVGAYIALVHVLLPFMILPIYSVMKGIAPNAMRAAISLGAHPFVAFARVYFPQTLSGLVSGSLLVFISALGFYITPALIGGAGDQMIGFFIAHYTTATGNWGMGAALACILLLATVLLFLTYGRLTRGSSTQWR